MPILHPDLAPADRKRLLLEGVALFNEARFFECHEAFEEVWRSTSPEPKDLLQGLIQVAVGMFHYLERQRPHVARRVLAKGRRRLQSYAPVALGLDVARLIDRARQWEVWLCDEGSSERADPPPLPRIRIVDRAELR